MEKAREMMTGMTTPRAPCDRTIPMILPRPDRDCHPRLGRTAECPPF